MYKDPDYMKKYRARNRERINAQRRARYRENLDNNRAKGAAKARRHRLNNPEVVLLRNAESRAKVLQVPFDLELIDIKVPHKCPILGIPIILGAEGQMDGSPSIDRIDPNGGYTKDNIHVISWRANRLKSDATVDELQRIFMYFYGLEAGTL